jgi:hypothetical protein
VITSADPVLLGPDPPGMIFQPGASKQSAIEREEVLDSNGVPNCNGAYRISHRVYVRQYLKCSDVARLLSELLESLRAQQPAGTCLQALDTGGGDRLCTQQYPGKSLGIGECSPFGIEANDGPLGVGDVGRDIAVECD